MCTSHGTRGTRGAMAQSPARTTHTVSPRQQSGRAARLRRSPLRSCRPSSWTASSTSRCSPGC
eukprot:3466623-Rhodomonas_salina.2